MDLRVNREKGTGLSYLSLFLIVFFLVLLGSILFGEEYIKYSKVLDKNSLQIWKLEGGESKALLLYVLKERLWVIPLMFLLATTYLAKMTGFVFVLWYGVSLGIVTGISLLRFGFVGIFLVLMAGMPHYLLYIPIFIFVLRMNGRQRVVCRKFYLQLFLLELMVLIGCILESYVNPILLKKIINFL